MINTKDQEELFRLIADHLTQSIECLAIGGTAMMFAQYKTTTKDIDLVFKSTADREEFIRAIEQLGYRRRGLGTIYTPPRKEHESKPLMYTRGEERFDLFVKDVFGYKPPFEIAQRNDFIGKKELTLLIPPAEELILLKAITRREKDLEDIETILEFERVNWQRIVDRAIEQKAGNEWILIDLEETLQELKKKHFIKQAVFDKLYNA